MLSVDLLKSDFPLLAKHLIFRKDSLVGHKSYL